MKRILIWCVPGGLVLLVSVSLVLGSDAFVERVSRGLPWLAYGAALLLATTAHRSRVVALVLVVLAVGAAASSEAMGTSTLPFAGGIFAVSVVVLAPLKDRGALSAMGLLQVGGAVALIVSGGSLLRLAPGAIDAFLAIQLIPTVATQWSMLPQPVLAALGLAFITALAVALVRKGPVEIGIVWSVALVGSALCFAGEGGRASILLMGAGLSLGLSVLDQSPAWVFKDELTGLPGRRLLLQDLQTMRGIYAAAIVDIDDFGRFNERYGHDVGDQVLRMVATRLAKAPGGSRAYRYGGDEFAVLFPGATDQEAMHHLQGFQRSLEESPFGLRRWRRPRVRPQGPGPLNLDGGEPARRLSVRVSVGVAGSAGADSPPDSVLGRADQAVHRARATAQGQAHA